MKSMIALIAILVVLFGSPLPAIEIATGSMLGPRYNPDRFYVRASPGSRWQQTYSDRQYRRKARGKLMSLSLTQALFDDEWLKERSFQPEQNTERAIEALNIYKEHGVLAISVSLQGGDPGYDPAANGIGRRDGAKFGQDGGLLVSAFRPDGSLKEDWLRRLEKLLQAANERGMVVCLTYFYQGQDEVFDSKRSIVKAAGNITDWLIGKNFRNVVINLAMDWNLEGDTWDHGRFIPENIAALLEYVRDRFNGADFLLPIGASSGGNMSYPASLARLCDVVLVHGNTQAPAEKLVRIQQFQSYERPVWMIEDDNGHDATLAGLSRETASANLLFRETAGWGYTPWVQAQRFPFEYRPGDSSEFTDQTPAWEREGAYFRAVLEHIAELVLRNPPSTASKNKRTD